MYVNNYVACITYYTPVGLPGFGRAVASIWFETWGSWIRLKKCRFFRQISEKFLFFQAISQKNSIFLKISTFSGTFRKKSIFQAKLAIYGYFWANYSISL